MLLILELLPKKARIVNTPPILPIEAPPSVLYQIELISRRKKQQIYKN